MVVFWRQSQWTVLSSLRGHEPSTFNRVQLDVAVQVRRWFVSQMSLGELLTSWLCWWTSREGSTAKAKCEDLKSQLDAAEEVACDKEVAVVATKTLLEESEKTMQEMSQKIDTAVAEVLAFDEVLAIFKDLGAFQCGK
ncbi:unnamed protein product [Cladocopium goreaui]|uniref:EF-hand domain-containing protein n=1 Tax=Cladocopium goreaui TaxID=2562237 RepID=A0A9P1BGB5_9DINO|nr:unnamed protein product [Cladocopium goreaui]